MNSIIRSIAKRLRPILSLTLVLSLILSFMPTSIAAGSGSKDTEYSLLDNASEILEADVFSMIAEVENNASRPLGGKGGMTEQDYVRLVPVVKETIKKSETYVPGSLQANGNFLSWETTTGISCCYSPRLQAQLNNSTSVIKTDDIGAARFPDEAMSNEIFSVSNGTSGSTKVGLIQPFWDSNIDYVISGSFGAGVSSGFYFSGPSYLNMWEKLYQSIGGTGLRYTLQNANISNIAKAIEQCCIVLIHSHGATDYENEVNSDDLTSRANCSYIVLTSGDGLKSSDFQKKAGQYGEYSDAYMTEGNCFLVSGTCIANHMTKCAPDSLVYMCCCLSMATDGLCKGLRNIGVETVWGYSQSITASGDKLYMESIMNDLSRGYAFGTAISRAKSKYGNWDPAYQNENYTESQARANRIAFPICVSSEDPYPGKGNVDAVQRVNSTWELWHKTTVTPSYDVSSQYASSKYYTALCNTRLSGNQREDIVNVAQSQVGYREGNCMADLNGGNTGGHSYNNFCEYNYFYWGKGGGSGYPWCAVFVSWCARQAGIPASILKNSAVAGCAPKGFNLPYKSGKTYTPKKGDLFFTSNWSHVGIVTGVSGNNFTTIEGNTNNNGSSEGIGVFARTRCGLSNYFFASPAYVECGHPSYASEHCTNCGALQPLQDYNYSCNTGIYVAKEKVYLRSDPYKTGPGFVNNCLITLPQGTEVIVEGAVVNGIGNTWFKVIYGNTSGYIYAPRLAYRRALVSSISASALSVPSSLKVGSSFHISGTITGQNCKITKGRAYFVNVASGTTVSNSTTSWVNVNSSSLSLYNHTIDNKLLFGKLSAGTYYYCIEVQTDRVVNGKTTHIFRSPNFTVGAAAIAAPTIIQSDAAIGSRTFSISSSGTKYYRVNGGAWVAGTSVTLYSSGLLEAKCVSGSSVSAISKFNVSIPVLGEPSIQSSFTPNGTTVTISAQSGAAILYQVDGGAVQQYNGTFTLTHAANVTAYAQRAGFITSRTASSDIAVSAPSIPSLVRDTASDIADGTAMSVHWAKDALASGYMVTVKKDGAVWKTETVAAAQYSFTTNGAGLYEVSATALNVIGGSSESNTVSCRAHAPSTVTFKDYDGNVLSVQTVSYGADATRPATPTRRGYTFSGWSAGFTGVTSDLTIVAEYEINIYTVKFFDVDGTREIATQEITFDEGIDSASVEPLVSIENGGRVFSGWYIMDADDASVRDLKHIDSNMKLRAVTVWGNENLPVYVDNISARLCYDSNNGMFNGYHVSCRVSTADARDINAKIIVTLLAVTNEETGNCKMINTKVDTINLTASASNMTWSGDILCDGTSGADYVDISVVSVEGNDRTGGLIAQTKRYTITSEASQFWSEWMTKEELESHGHTVSESTVESKTQYSDRVNTKSIITTSSSTPPAGYTLLSNNSDWGPWSGWSTTPVSASSTRQVEQENRHTGYNMSVYNTMTTGGKRQFRSWSVGGKYSTYGLASSYGEYHYTLWASKDAVNSAPTVAEGAYTSACSYPGYNKGTGTGYVLNNGSGLYVFFIASNAYTMYYRYRDWISSYTYYKWDYGNWTDWTDNVLTDSNLSDPSYEVRTRQMYRYVVFDASQIEHNTSGTTQTVSGQLEEANTDLEGRLASIFVYKSLNSDPTEAQLEYIGQTTLGQNGTYNFTFTTKEEASVETGDFVIALAVEGSDGLINVGLVKYERPTYTVTFVTENGTISTQQVEEGGSATVPEAPAIEGFTFTGWNKSTTNVTKNMTVVAQYKPKDCSVVFVDYLNQVCELQHFDYGSVLVIPESMEQPTHEGYTFMGWSFGDDATVTGDQIVSVLWEAKTYTVSFFDETGMTTVSTQTVPYGGFATPPESLDVDDGKTFLGWSDETPWWNVTSDISVYPIVAYLDTTAAPAPNISEVTEGLREELTFTSEEGATILYTLDGSDPALENVVDNSAENITFIYSDPLILTEDCVVRAKAISEGKNDSEITEVVFVYSDDLNDPNDRGEIIDLLTQDVMVSEFDAIDITIDLSVNPHLAGYGFYIKADPATFYLDFDRNTLEASAAVGTLCADGGALVVNNYDEVLGWHLIWVGEPSDLANGSLLTVRLIAGAETPIDSYPITVGYTSGDTYGTDNERVALESSANVTITTSAHEHTYVDGVCTVCGAADPNYTDTDLTISAEPITAMPGATIRVPVMIAGDGCFAGFTMSISSSESLTLANIEKGALLKTGDGSFTKNIALGNVNWTSAENLDGNGELFVLTFAVSDEAEDGSQETVTIQIKDHKPTNFVDESGTPVAVQINPIVINIQTITYGDVDGDGDVTTADAVRLVRYLVELVELTEQQQFAADVSHDGDITSADSIKLVRYLVGLEDSLEPTRTGSAHNTPSTANVTVQDVSGQQGDQITVPVTISGNPGFAGFTFEIDYPEVLELTEVSVGNLLKGSDNGSFTCNLNKRLVNWTSISNVSEDGELFHLTFRVLDDIDGSLPICVMAKDGTNSNFANENGKAIVVIPFKDMPAKDHWAYSAIGWAVANRITAGTSATSFSPSKECTRAQIVTFLWRAAGSPEPSITENPFHDVPETAYYYTPVLWAVEKGITVGTSATAFSPNKPCTRAQIVTFLWRYEGSPTATDSCSPFIDVENGAYYEGAVLWAAEAGITAGTSLNTFAPNAVCTRAQIVTFLFRNSKD